jgi:hypothetical protein
MQNSSQQDTAMKIKENVRNHWYLKINSIGHPMFYSKKTTLLKERGFYN